MIIKIDGKQLRLQVTIRNKNFGVGSLRSVEAKVLDYNIAVREFDLQSCYYFNFWTNTLGKDMNPFIPQL